MIEFERSTLVGFPTEPLTWKAVRQEGNITADIICPNGHFGVLDHEIAHDGIVTPSVDCPRCDFHDSIKLLHWGEYLEFRRRTE